MSPASFVLVLNQSINQSTSLTHKLSVSHNLSIALPDSRDGRYFTVLFGSDRKDELLLLSVALCISMHSHVCAASVLFVVFQNKIRRAAELVGRRAILNFAGFLHYSKIVFRMSYCSGPPS